jgi:hypothetical protein
MAKEISERNESGGQRIGVLAASAENQREIISSESENQYRQSKAKARQSEIEKITAIEWRIVSKIIEMWHRLAYRRQRGIS